MKVSVFVALLLTVPSVQAGQAPPVQTSQTPSVQASQTPSVKTSQTSSVQASQTSSVQASETSSVQASQTSSLQASQESSVQASQTATEQASQKFSVKTSQTSTKQASQTPSVQVSQTPSVQASQTSSEQASQTSSVKTSKTSTEQASQTSSEQANEISTEQASQTPNIPGSRAGGGECILRTPGGYVDLTPLVSQNGTARFSEQSGDYEYMWNPCQPFSAEQVCQEVAVCQRVVGSNFYVLLARQDGLVQDKEGQLVLFYTGMDPTDRLTRETYISLVCDPTIDGDFKFDIESPIRQYHFTLTSKYACERGSPSVPVTTPTPQPGPAPSPSPPGHPLFAIVVLLGCILVSLCILNCMVFLGLVTRRRKREVTESHEHINQAFEKKLPLPYFGLSRMAEHKTMSIQRTSNVTNM